VKKGRAAGFTLIEIVVVMVLIGILAIIVIPKYVDLAQLARVSTTQASLSKIRSYVHMEYANRAATGLGATFPPSITASNFANNTLPLNQLNNLSGVNNVSSAPSGTATSGSLGFWYISSNGSLGAYSDGTTDTSGW